MTDGNEVVAKIEEVAKVEEVAKKRGRPRKYPFPSQLVCSKTGVIVKTNPTQMATMVAKSGKDLETFVKEYICRSARKVEKVPKVKRVKRVKKIKELAAAPITEPAADTIPEPIV